MTVYTAVVATLGWLYLFFLLYVSVMGLYRCHLAGELNPVLRVLGAPVLAVGAIADVLTNVTIAWAIFLEPPRELLVTTRLKRYLSDPGERAWRRAVAQWTCTWLLNPFDPRGRHC